MKKKTTILFVVIALMVLPLAWAASTTTQINFNIATIVGYTLTLPGQSAVSATSGGAPTTAIEFNSSSGTDNNVNARVVGGSSQTNGTPIFQFDNTGTVDLNISLVLDSDPSSCINLTGATTYSGADNGQQISTSNVTVVTGFTPAASTQDWYLKADFASCLSTDSGQRTLTTYGVQS